MSKMSDLHLELNMDFEQLTETSMQWSKSTWGKQVKEGRFEALYGDITYDHTHIYWFESYANLLLAKSILAMLGQKYSVLLDDAMGQYAITTTYETYAWRD